MGRFHTDTNTQRRLQDFIELHRARSEIDATIRARRTLIGAIIKHHDEPHPVEVASHLPKARHIKAIITPSTG